MVYIPQFVHYLEIVEAAMFYYYVSEFLRKLLRGYFWYVFLKYEIEWYSNFLLNVLVITYVRDNNYST